MRAASELDSGSLGSPPRESWVASRDRAFSDTAVGLRFISSRSMWNSLLSSVVRYVATWCDDLTDTTTTLSHSSSALNLGEIMSKTKKNMFPNTTQDCLWVWGLYCICTCRAMSMFPGFNLSRVQCFQPWKHWTLETLKHWEDRICTWIKTAGCISLLKLSYSPSLVPTETFLPQIVQSIGN